MYNKFSDMLVSTCPSIHHLLNAAYLSKVIKNILQTYIIINVYKRFILVFCLIYCLCNEMNHAISACNSQNF